jgi:hypothetical protein
MSSQSILNLVKNSTVGTADQDTTPTPRFSRGARDEQPSEPVVAPTESQVGFIRDLLDDIATVQPQVVEEQRRILNAGYLDHTLTKAKASLIIDDLKGRRTELGIRPGARNQKAEQPSVPELEDGLYALPTGADATNQVAFYRVYHFKGRQYAVMQVGPQEQRMSQAVAHSVMERIAADPLEAMRMYGRETGTCRDCGRRLTNDESRAVGIGPDCFKKRS